MIAFIILCVLLLLGHMLRGAIPLLRWLYLPSCVIAGLLGLIILQLAPVAGVDIPTSFTEGWSSIPGLLIDVVFACLFLGVSIPGLRSVWRQAGPQLAFGQVIAWGQYVIGVGLVLVFLGPVFGVPAIFGGIIPVGFEGGHGTAAGLGQVFTDYGFPEGKDLGLASATVGLCSAVVVGMMLINWAVRRGMVENVAQRDLSKETEDTTIATIPLDQRGSAGTLTVKADAIETFTLQLIFVALAVGFGYLLKEGMVMWEAHLNGGLIDQIDALKASLVGATTEQTGAIEAKIANLAQDRARTSAYILESFPRFPLCMIGGMLVQLWSQKFDRRAMLDTGLIRRIQNGSLDFLVVAAIAVIQIQTLTAYLWPFLIIVVAAILWNVFCVTVLAKRMLPDAYFERAIAEMGQSMGVTATGLLLLRVVDPNYKTKAASAFAYKQILHEPFMGGGLWTSTAIPLLIIWGPVPVLGIAMGAVAFWLILTFFTPLIKRT